jgi:hypothetical protein
MTLLSFVLVGCECDADPFSAIPDPGAITGRVCDPGEGRGIFGAKVWVVIDYGDGTSGEITANSDVDGNFSLEQVPVGTYDVFIERGSFAVSVEDVDVLEGETTALDEAACIEPEVVATVYTGHDTVEDVLTRLGFDNFTLVDTRSGRDEHDENTPSWIVEQFGDFSSFVGNDILFINCGAHEWAVDNADAVELEMALDNLRRFVNNGGSIYFSDWSYDLVEMLWPDAVDWLGDDSTRNDAEHGEQQIFVGTVLDEDILAVLGRERASLKYDLGRIAMPVSLGEGARAMIEADIEVEDPDTGQLRMLTATPVLVDFSPPGIEGTGRVIFTTFHNGANNTEAMDDVLRAIVFSL